jgi:hypothetical protein
MRFRNYKSALLFSAFLCCFFDLASLASPGSDTVPAASPSQVIIPGPLRSFLRMAGISQKITPDEVLPLLSRNVIVSGYDGGKPTQFLVLLNWYLDQARELQALAGPQGVVHVSNCEQAKPLLIILGYRLRQPCGPNAALETADANRAFLTIDSGFPLADLEDTLRGGPEFIDPYPSTPIPVLFTSAEWLGNGKYTSKSVVDSLLRDPGLARLYWSLARMDDPTSRFLEQSIGIKKLIAFGPVLDFYGGHISVRDGGVIVPGGAKGENAWKDLVGTSPRNAVDFLSRMFVKDEGWMAAYFDALSRTGPRQQAYFSDSGRLRRYYEALRGKDVMPSPTRHSFRPDQGLFLLLSNFQLDANNQPHIPGNLDVWKMVMQQKTDSKVIRDWGKRSGNWNSPEQVMEGMAGISRYSLENGELYCFLMLSEIDRGRLPDQRLSPQTFHLLAQKFSRFGDQYPIFSEFHNLNDASITQFLATAENLDQIPDRLVRADSLGMLQANIGLWQILSRQGQIANGDENSSWQKVVNAFKTVRTSAQVFEAGSTALDEILKASTGRPFTSQDQIIAALAGPNQEMAEGQQVRQQLANRIRVVLDDQRLVSLDTLHALGDGLIQMAKGTAHAEAFLPLTAELHEFEMPKPLFTTRERSQFVSGLYGNRHTTLQMRTDLTNIMKQPSSPAALSDARGLLTPFLRDTLVGLNYAYYEPPGAQMLHSNPLFVRSHDFSGGDYSGQTSMANEYTWRSPRLFGRGWTASGGAHLIGSMADLPYVLAKVEQDFIVPQNVQSLIWEDLVPGLMTSAVLPRWWKISRNELHAVALYQRAGEELMAASNTDAHLRETVINILSDRMLPQRAEQVEAAIRAKRMEDLPALVAPAESFYLAAEYRQRFPGETEHFAAAGKELEQLTLSDPAEVGWDRLSDDFGVPHPALEHSYALELLNTKPVPTFLNYSSRLLAESWDSNNLYWARLADEMGYPPVMLNLLVPQLTLRMVEKTFASHLEDWPAMLRAMRETGLEFRQGKVAALQKTAAASGL